MISYNGVFVLWIFTIKLRYIYSFMRLDYVHYYSFSEQNVLTYKTLLKGIWNDDSSFVKRLKDMMMI